jgi:hypothetical protein
MVGGDNGFHVIQRQPTYDRIVGQATIHHKETDHRSDLSRGSLYDD